MSDEIDGMPTLLDYAIVGLTATAVVIATAEIHAIATVPGLLLGTALGMWLALWNRGDLPADPA